MNQLNTFMKQKFDMKTFDHVKLHEELPEIYTETINKKYKKAAYTATIMVLQVV